MRKGTNEVKTEQAMDKYMEEWSGVCKAYAKKVGAELVFVNLNNFGIIYPNGETRHIYADELQELLLNEK